MEKNNKEIQERLDIFYKLLDVIKGIGKIEIITNNPTINNMPLNPDESVESALNLAKDVYYEWLDTPELVEKYGQEIIAQNKITDEHNKRFNLSEKL